MIIKSKRHVIVCAVLAFISGGVKLPPNKREPSFAIQKV